LQESYDEFSKRDTVVIAISQEDKDLASAKKIMKAFKGKTPPFSVAVDANRKNTIHYDRTTTYFIDKGGIVRQIFPMLIHHRASWETILSEVDRLTQGT